MECEILPCSSMSFFRASMPEYPVRSFNLWPAMKMLDWRWSIRCVKRFETCDLRPSSCEGSSVREVLDTMLTVPDEELS